jgi:hypothetical protein
MQCEITVWREGMGGAPPQRAVPAAVYTVDGDDRRAIENRQPRCQKSDHTLAEDRNGGANTEVGGENSVESYRADPDKRGGYRVEAFGKLMAGQGSRVENAL